MKGVSNLLFREKTRARRQGATTLSAPGKFAIEYGKTHFFVSGQGQPGGATTPGTLAGYNPDTGGNVAGYNPDTGGNVSGYNPDTGGNVVGYNPIKSGTLAGYNPITGGNYAYSNPTYQWGSSFTDFYDNINKWHDYSNNDHPWGPSINKPSSFTYTANLGYPGYSVVNFYVIGSSPGNPVYNPRRGGNAYYNPDTGGNAIYSPVVKGNANYNPVVKGNANYTPVVPGNAFYNPDIPGKTGTSFSVGGVEIKGGTSDQPGQKVEKTLAKIPYNENGEIFIDVPPGAFVTIENIN